jgi:predicted nucleic acid-binding protein
MARLIFDANVVIALFDQNNQHHQNALSFYLRSSGDEIHLASLTYAEILAQPATNGQLQFFVKNLATAGFKVRDLDLDLAIEAAKVKGSTSLKMPDAVVVALARKLGGVAVTFDKKLHGQAKELKVKTKYLG